MLTREDCLYLAKLAEQTEDFDQMMAKMKDVVKFGQELDQAERNMFSVAYKNSINPQRTALRTLKAIERKEEGKKSKNVHLVQEEMLKVKKEMTDRCEELVNLLDTQIMSTATTALARVFWRKMKGDYYRYLAELSERKGNYGELSHKAYKEAFQIAQAQLAPTCPIRLGLVLNYSVYFYEIEDNPAKACEMAKQAFDEAIATIESITEDDYKDSTTIMQLLRDNLSLWTQELEEKEDDEK